MVHGFVVGSRARGAVGIPDGGLVPTDAPAAAFGVAGVEVVGVGGGADSAIRRGFAMFLSVAKPLPAKALAGGRDGREGGLEVASLIEEVDRGGCQYH